MSDDKCGYVVEGSYTCNGSPQGCEGERFGGCEYHDTEENEKTAYTRCWKCKGTGQRVVFGYCDQSDPDFISRRRDGMVIRCDCNPPGWRAVRDE